METILPISPPNASRISDSVDALFAIELAFSALTILLIAGLILYFSWRYRRRSPHDTPAVIGHHYGLEAFWSGATFVAFTCFFFMGAALYVSMKDPPEHAQEVYVVGKQWMWKIQHADGLREINELHVPVGQPTKLIMTSEDVVHDFFVPAFRMKQDVIPGSYTSAWFTATEPGVYHVFCAQYCGAEHSLMVGSVIVLTQADYDSWRAGLGPVATPAEAGRKLFVSYGCSQCHGQTAPGLAGLYLSHVKLQDGSTVVADDDYLRRSIVDPGAQIVAGFPPIMPTYRSQLTGEQVNALIEYIKSLKSARGPSATQPANDSSLLHVTPDLPPAQRRPEVQPPPGGNNP